MNKEEIDKSREEKIQIRKEFLYLATMQNDLLYEMAFNPYFSKILLCNEQEDLKKMYRSIITIIRFLRPWITKEKSKEEYLNIIYNDNTIINNALIDADSILDTLLGDKKYSRLTWNKEYEKRG